MLGQPSLPAAWQPGEPGEGGGQVRDPLGPLVCCSPGKTEIEYCTGLKHARFHFRCGLDSSPVEWIKKVNGIDKLLQWIETIVKRTPTDQ